MLRYFILQCFLSRTEESQEREYLDEDRETSQYETVELMRAGRMPGLISAACKGETEVSRHDNEPEWYLGQ